MLITSDISAIADLILQNKGAVIAYPTETVYGLGARIIDKAAISKIYRIKGRDSTKGMIVLIPTMEMAAELAEIDSAQKRLLEHFWPGPLTAIAKARRDLDPRLVQNGCIAIRISCDPHAGALVDRVGSITSTSANMTGKPPAKSPEGVLKYNLSIDGILDGGQTKARKPSTIIDLTRWPPVCIRQGKIPFSDIEGICVR